MTEPDCTLVGILDDGWTGLGDTARRRLADAALVVGASRTLELVAPHLSAACRHRNMDGALREVPAWVRATRAEGGRSVVLATGDPLCHGIGAWLVEALGREHVAVLPAPSTLQLAFARLGRPWADYRLVSCHGADAGEWQAGAGPEHGLYELVRAVAEHPRVAAFTGPGNDPARVARALAAAGYGDEVSLTVAARLALPDERLFPDLTLAAAAAMRFPHPNVLLVERRDPAPEPIFGLADERYSQRHPEKGLITKLEVRAVTLAKLGIRADSIVWDIGAGSGAVGLEASRLARRGHVWAIEKNAADALHARENAASLKASNYTLVEGRAPDHLASWPDPDAVFIGGSGGELAELIGLALGRLKPGGRLVMNFTTIENLAAATAILTAARSEWEAVQLNAARSRPILGLHRLAAQNPIWIVSTHVAPKDHEP